jgi:hypothetical protein
VSSFGDAGFGQIRWIQKNKKKKKCSIPAEDFNPAGLSIIMISTTGVAARTKVLFCKKLKKQFCKK